MRRFGVSVKSSFCFKICCFCLVTITWKDLSGWHVHIKFLKSFFFTRFLTVTIGKQVSWECFLHRSGCEDFYSLSISSIWDYLNVRRNFLEILCQSSFLSGWFCMLYWQQIYRRHAALIRNLWTLELIWANEVVS